MLFTSKFVITDIVATKHWQTTLKLAEMGFSPVLVHFDLQGIGADFYFVVTEKADATFEDIP